MHVYKGFCYRTREVVLLLLCLSLARAHTHTRHLFSLISIAFFCSIRIPNGAICAIACFASGRSFWTFLGSRRTPLPPPTVYPCLGAYCVICPQDARQMASTT
ncbi:hypothetical protein F5Y17DRAFT_252588 [Xylariaceae sp. FL0594]|nr:hypothetical protein F5Y17DRAFT_252588 [Xylariaceae sp. FL0594]